MSKTNGTVRFFLKEPNGDKPTPVRAVFSYAYKQFIHYEKKLSIHPKFWSKEKQRAKQAREFSGYSEFNVTLEDIANGIAKVYRRFKQDNDSKEPSLNELRDLVNVERGKTEENSSKKITLFGFIEKFLENSYSRTNPNTSKFITARTIKAYAHTYSILTDFAKYKNRNFDFDDITTDFYNDYTKYMTDVLKWRLNTIGKHQRNLKVFMRDAFERKVTDNRDFMNRSFRVANENVEDVYLDEIEIKLLEEIDLSKNKKLERVRDLFIIGCRVGLRYADLSKLTKDNIQSEDGKTNLIVKTQKTDKKVIIPLFENTLNVIN
ncbi:MAG: phage integrase SAM-like domain-containing protein, partial [Ferruginibacter sp.]